MKSTLKKLKDIKYQTNKALAKFTHEREEGKFDTYYKDIPEEQSELSQSFNTFPKVVRQVIIDFYSQNEYTEEGEVYSAGKYEGSNIIEAKAGTATTSLRKCFENAVHLRKIDGIDLTGCTTLESVCKGALRLRQVSLTNTITVSSIFCAFQEAKSLESVNVTEWVTDNVISLANAFNECSSLKTLDVSSWNTSKVTNMTALFRQCTSLESVEVSNWNTSNVQSMNQMFASCKGLLSVPDVGNWDVSQVTDMAYMFNDYPLKTPPNVSNWNTINVTTTSYMFGNNKNIVSPPDVSKWNVENLVIMNGMFYNCSSMTEQPDFSQWSIPNLTDISLLFRNCTNLSTIDISALDTSNVSTMAYAFSGTSITDMDLSNNSSKSLTSIDYLFYACRRLQDITFGTFTCEKVKNFQFAFNSCSALKTVDLGSLCPQDVTNAQAMFGSGNVVESLDFSNFTFNDTCVVSGMIQCPKLATLKLGTLDVANKSIEDNSFMMVCPILTHIDGAITNITSNIANRLGVAKSPLDRETIVMILNGLIEYTDGAEHVISLSTTSKSYLTDEDIVIALMKGWTIA